MWGLLISAVRTLAFAEPAAVSGRAMGTAWSVKWIQPEHAIAPEVVRRQAATRLEELEQQFSTYRPGSVLSRFNAEPAGEWFDVPRDLAIVAEQSREVSERTGGAFDVTVYPLIRLWGFGGAAGGGRVPSAENIAATRALVGWRELEVRREPAALRKTKRGVEADLSSMAKGYAADELSELLRRLGVAQHVVQIGGDVRTAGTNAEGTGWRIAIERPGANAAEVASIVELAGQAVSTSGNYRNFFEAGGRRYGHILDPRTGAPVQGNLAAVSVVHESAGKASAWATALFVLGVDEGLRVAKEQRLAAMFQVREGEKVVQRTTAEFEWKR